MLKTRLKCLKVGCAVKMRITMRFYWVRGVGVLGSESFGKQLSPVCRFSPPFGCKPPPPTCTFWEVGRKIPSNLFPNPIDFRCVGCYHWKRKDTATQSAPLPLYPYRIEKGVTLCRVMYDLRPTTLTALFCVPKGQRHSMSKLKKQWPIPTDKPPQTAKTSSS